MIAPRDIPMTGSTGDNPMIKRLLNLGGKYSKPNHVALTVDGTFVYASRHKIDLPAVFEKNFQNIQDCVKVVVSKDIPVITFNLLPEYMRESSHFTSLMDSLGGMFEKLRDWDFLHSNQIKVSVFGKWYDLPARVVEPIKETVASSKDYDRFFLNFCINYNGQEEIVDACKLIIKKVAAGKMNPDMITRETMKDNIYSSYFIPPDLLIKTGKAKRLKGFLLWDSMDSKLYFPEKYWPEFTKQDFERSLEFYQGE